MVGPGVEAIRSVASEKRPNKVARELIDFGHGGSPLCLGTCLALGRCYKHWPGAFVLVGRYSFLVCVLVQLKYCSSLMNCKLIAKRVLEYMYRVIEIACCLRAVCALFEGRPRVYQFRGDGASWGRWGYMHRDREIVYGVKRATLPLRHSLGL